MPSRHCPATGLDYWPKDAGIIEVDINPNRIGLTKRVGVGIAGDATKVAEGILARLAKTAGDAGALCSNGRRDHGPRTARHVRARADDRRRKTGSDLE
jgi:thiamine pyrophosphate-dependent acetolactate synthase large subunit-like protein